MEPSPAGGSSESQGSIVSLRRSHRESDPGTPQDQPTKGPGIEMSSYLLDTNVVSELRKPRPHGAVVAWLDGTADEELHLSAVTLGEMQAGVEITREHDPKKASEIEILIDHVAQTWNLLPVHAPRFRTS